MIQVIKRDGEIADFNLGKITEAIKKAFKATKKDYNNEILELLSLRVTADFQNKMKDGKISVEQIQDSAEHVLEETGYTDVAKAYILYRDKRSRSRDMKSILLESIENESSDDINLFDVFENLMNDAMDKTRKEDLKKVFKLLKELNIDEEIIYQKVSETFAMTDETLKSVIK